MKIKILFQSVLFVLFIFSFLDSFSQAVMQFSKKTYHFGKIREVDGVVSYDFQFTNTGDAPIIIKNVESSCGCTTPQWSKEPVLPGKTGFVKAIFDPQNRPGHFDKMITVTSNARIAVVELKIQGEVEGKTRTILDDYPYEQASGLRLSLEDISLMSVRKGETKVMSVGVYNNSGKKVAVSFMGLPSYLKLNIEPQQIEPQQKAVIKASYITALKGEYGLNKEEVTMLVNGKQYRVPVSIFIEEDFSRVDMACAPRIEAEKRFYDFGQTRSIQPAVFSYRFKNTGKSPLKIHRFYTNDDRVVIEMTGNELQPGESATLTAKTKNGAEPGKLTCVISVITNSPADFQFNLRFYGEIK